MRRCRHFFWHCAIASRQSVVLPEDSGPKISTTRPAGQTADAERQVHAEGACGNNIKVFFLLAAVHFHNGAFAEVFFLIWARAAAKGFAFFGLTCFLRKEI